MRSKCEETLSECKHLQDLIENIRDDLNTSLNQPIEVKLLERVNEFMDVPVPVSKKETICYELSGSDDERYTPATQEKTPKEWLSEEEVKSAEAEET